MKLKPLSALVFLALCFFSCGKKEVKEDFVRPVKVTTVKARHEIKRDFSGVVDAVKYVNLAFRVPGQIINLPVVEGQKVTQGQLIAQIDPREISLQYESAKAQYETSKAQLERNERLLAKQAVSQQEYEIAKANYQQAKSNYEAQQNNMTDTRLLAPFSGSIATRNVENYQRVNPGQAIVKLIDSRDLQIDFTVPDNYLPYLQHPDKSFTVEFDMYRGIRFKAALKEFVEASPEGSGIPVFLTIDDPRFSKDKYDIKPGFSCNVAMNIIFENKGSEYPYVPLTALFGSKEGKDEFVWVLNEANNTVSARKVTTGALTEESNILITDGLKNGEIVVTAGVTQLVDGEKVKVLK